MPAACSLDLFIRRFIIRCEFPELRMTWYTITWRNVRVTYADKTLHLHKKFLQIKIIYDHEMAFVLSRTQFGTKETLFWGIC